MPRPREGKKPVTVYLDEEIYKEAKKAAIDEDKQFMELLEEVVSDWVRARAKRKR
jgi:hypothetical protein